ncbi:MAG: glycosyltransferase [Pseudonocardiaceae bacterium]
MFAALAAHGHTYPLIPLAVAARQAGHDVVFATGEQFLPGLRAAGLEAVPAGMSIGEAFAGLMSNTTVPQDLDRRTGEVFGDVLPRRWVTDMAPLVEVHRPDLMIYEAVTLGAGLAGVLAGIPVLAHGFGRMSPSAMFEATVDAFTAFAAELGSADVPLSAPFIDVCPESVQSKHFLEQADRIPLRPVGWNEPGELPSGVRERDRSRPLVYLTLGTAFAGVDVLKQAIEGLAVLAVDVLVAAGPAVDLAALGEVAPNVRLEAWVPQADLLPYVDLVVHHGGSGTMLGAFSAGLPQLLLPQGADQFTNAEAVLDAGAGFRLLPAELSRDAVTDKVQALLADEAVHAAVGRLADEVAAMPSPEDVAAGLPSGHPVRDSRPSARWL